MRRIRTAVAIVACFAVLGSATGCTKRKDAGTSPPAGDVPSPTVQTQGEPIVVAVAPDRALTVAVPGLGHLTAPVGTFTATGRVVVHGLQSDSPDGSLIAVGGTGVDVAFEGTSLASPITILFDDPAATRELPKDALPVVLHKPDGGDWEAKSLSRTSAGVPYLATKDFSPNLFGWIPVPDWVRDLADSFADFTTQRTDARACNGPAAPDWSSVDKRTTLVHLCSIANADRAEVQVQSNRRFYQWVAVPSGADYVWVEDQSDPVRRVIAKVTGHDAGGNVLLAGNGRFTAGYKQPAQTGKKDFNAYLDPWSAGLSVGMSVLGLDPRTKVTSAAWIVASCVKELLPFPSADGAKAFLACFVTQALKNLDNPDVAFSSAKDLYGEAAYAKEAADGLKQAKDRLRYLGKFLKVIGIITSTFPQLPDLFSSWGNDQPGRFTLQLKGKPAAPPPGDQGGDSQPPPPPAQPQAVRPYDNYGAANAGRAMCRGNPGNSRSMPGGTASQTFVVPAGVASVDHVMVQIDPDATVTAHLKVYVNGGLAATADAAAAGDTQFSFGAVAVSAGQTLTVALTFTATAGKITTVYTAGAPGGTFTASNSCPDGAPNVSTATTGLRAVVSGWTRS